METLEEFGIVEQFAKQYLESNGAIAECNLFG
jgi:hypothetical protein